MEFRSPFWVVAFVLLFLVACNSAGSVEVVPTPTARPIPTADSVNINPNAIPDVDTSQHTVPLEEIYFDTFQPVNRTVPLSEASLELIHSLRDAIPPLYTPNFVGVEEANAWLRDEELVLGYAEDDVAYAYPIKILNWHEIVSHEVDGRSLMATYCPPCRSGVVYDRNVAGQTLLFGNTSALYESNMVLFDHQTGSYWMQTSGEAIVGTMAGQQLATLPSGTTAWGVWKRNFPHTVVLSRQTGYQRNYEYDPFTELGQQLNEEDRFLFPVSENGRDARLRPGEVVLGVEVGDVQRAYPIERMGDGVANDVVAETAVVVFSLAEGPTGVAYSPVVAGNALTFTYSDGQFRDEQTGSTWTIAGLAIDGNLQGTQLEALPTRSSFWFSLIASFPDLEVYRGK